MRICYIALAVAFALPAPALAQSDRTHAYDWADESGRDAGTGGIGWGILSLGVLVVAWLVLRSKE